MNNTDIIIYELYDIWYKPFWHSTWFIIFCVCSIMGILVFFGWYLYFFYWTRKFAKEPWRKPLKNLSELDVLLFAEASKHKVFYTILIDILKKYFALIFIIKLDDKTDQEVLELLAQSKLSAGAYEDFMAIVQGAMTIKFASQESALERMRYDLVRAVSVIKSTMPNTL